MRVPVCEDDGAATAPFQGKSKSCEMRACFPVPVDVQLYVLRP